MHFHEADFGWVSDVVQGFELVKVLQVVHHPQVIVIVHSNIQLLHGLRSVTTLGNGAVNTVLSQHELSILLPNPIDDVWSMDV